MAKTTRKTEPPTAEKKPATRRPKAAPVPDAEQLTARRRIKAAPEAAPVERVLVPAPTHDEIALRAWSIYENRGGGHGQAMDDWLEAKRQLFAERGLEA